MAKPKPIQITIPNPCHQNWQDMEPRTTGRHCEHCDKTVTDFTRFTDAQLLDYFANHKEKTCGRFTAWQVGRVLQVPQQPHSRLYRMFIALGLTLVFTQMPDAKGQINSSFLKIENSHKFSDDTTPLASVIVRLSNEQQECVVGDIKMYKGGILKGQLVADINGIARIDSVEVGRYDLHISSQGYPIHIIQNFVVPVDNMVECTVMLQQGTTDIIVISGSELLLFERKYKPSSEMITGELVVKDEK